MSKLLQPKFTPDLSPDVIYTGLTEFFEAAAKQRVDRRWPNCEVTEFELPKSATILLDPENRTKSTVDQQPVEYLSYRFAGEAEYDGSATYTLEVNSSVPAATKSINPDHMFELLTATSEEYEEDVLRVAENYFPNDPDFDMSRVSIRDAMFLRRVIDEIVANNDLSLRRWANFGYVLDENTVDFTYAESRGYLLGSTEIQTVEYSTVNPTLMMQQVHGEGLDGLEREHKLELPQALSSYQHMTMEEDAAGLIYTNAFNALIYDEFDEAYMGNLPLVVHANNAAMMLYKFLNSKILR